MSVTLYGLKGCDTVKKARVWLANHRIDHGFHDFRADGLDPAWLQRWAGAVGWETLLNRAGTTFKALPEADKTGIDAHKAFALMAAQPAMIKRPVLEGRSLLVVGFKPQVYQQAFGV